MLLLHCRPQHSNVTLSSDLIPFATKDKDEVDLDWQVYFRGWIRCTKEAHKEFRHPHYPFHPGQYTVLNSKGGCSRTRNCLIWIIMPICWRYWAVIKSNKMRWFILVVFMAIKTPQFNSFIQVANSLSSKIRRHLVIENDEHLFNIEDVTIY